MEWVKEFKEMGWLEDFIRESNRIEGILRDPTEEELGQAELFLGYDRLIVERVEYFVNIFQPGAKLRRNPNMNVRVGNYIAPPGGPNIVKSLGRILGHVNQGHVSPYVNHLRYETLHPFTDGNGRSGRMIWLWQMREAPLGFLHQWYYQSLQVRRCEEARDGRDGGIA